MVMQNAEYKTVLAVDSDPKALLNSMAKLSQAGYHVQTATTGDDALKVARARRVHAVTVSAGLGGHTDCLRLAEEMSRDSRLARVPIVLLNVNGDKTFLEKCKAVGIKHFVPKPGDWDWIVRLLDGIVHRNGLVEVEVPQQPAI